MKINIYKDAMNTIFTSKLKQIFLVGKNDWQSEAAYPFPLNDCNHSAPIHNENCPYIAKLFSYPNAIYKQICGTLISVIL